MAGIGAFFKELFTGIKDFAKEFGPLVAGLLSKLKDKEYDEFWRQLGDKNAPWNESYAVWCARYDPQIIETGDVWDGPHNVQIWRERAEASFRPLGKTWTDSIGHINFNMEYDPNMGAADSGSTNSNNTNTSNNTDNKGGGGNSGTMQDPPKADIKSIMPLLIIAGVVFIAGPHIIKMIREKS